MQLCKSKIVSRFLKIKKEKVKTTVWVMGRSGHTWTALPPPCPPTLPKCVFAEMSGFPAWPLSPYHLQDLRVFWVPVCTPPVHLPFPSPQEEEGLSRTMPGHPHEAALSPALPVWHPLLRAPPGLLGPLSAHSLTNTKCCQHKEPESESAAPYPPHFCDALTPQVLGLACRPLSHPVPVPGGCHSHLTDASTPPPLKRHPPRATDDLQIQYLLSLHPSSSPPSHLWPYQPQDLPNPAQGLDDLAGVVGPWSQAAWGCVPAERVLTV